MICKNCGNEIEDNSRFCMNCGTPVDSASLQHQLPVKNAHAKGGRRPLTKTSKILIAVILVIAAIVCSVMASFLFNDKNKIMQTGNVNGDNQLSEEKSPKKMWIPKHAVYTIDGETYLTVDAQWLSNEVVFGIHYQGLDTDTYTEQELNIKAMAEYNNSGKFTRITLGTDDSILRFPVEITYDEDNKIQQACFCDNGFINWKYDKSGKVESIELDNMKLSTKTVHFSYDDRNNYSEIYMDIDGEGLEYKYENSEGDIAVFLDEEFVGSMIYEESFFKSFSVINDDHYTLQYNYDSNGNITNISFFDSYKIKNDIKIEWEKTDVSTQALAGKELHDILSYPFFYNIPSDSIAMGIGIIMKDVVSCIW